MVSLYIRARHTISTWMECNVILIISGVLAYSPEMPQDFREKTRVLYNKYYPMEISHSLTEEERLPFMVEWYEKSHELIVGTGVDKEFLKQLVLHSKCVLR